MERVERGEFDSRVLSRSSISFFPRRCILGEKAPVSWTFLLQKPLFCLPLIFPFF